MSSASSRRSSVAFDRRLESRRDPVRVDSFLKLLDCLVAVAAARVANRRFDAASGGSRERYCEDIQAACVEEGAEDPKSRAGTHDQADHRFRGHPVDALRVDLATRDDSAARTARCGTLQRPAAQARASSQTRSRSIGSLGSSSRKSRHDRCSHRWMPGRHDSFRSDHGHTPLSRPSLGLDHLRERAERHRDERLRLRDGLR